MKMENTLSLSELINRYINYIDIKTETKRGYKKILEEYSVYITKLTDSPKRSDLLTYREYLKSRLRASSVQKYLVVIRNFYSWCHIEGYGDNIAEGIKGVKIQSDFKREALSVTEAHKLLFRAKLHSTKSIEGLRNYAIIALLLTTGLRTIEVERADVADINTVSDIKILYVMGKGHDDKDTFVKLSPQVYEIIERYLIERGDQFEPLFISQHTKTKGERLKTRSIRGIVKELLRQIGIDNKKYSAHS
jgi:site-specific recombinase XerD